MKYYEINILLLLFFDINILVVFILECEDSNFLDKVSRQSVRGNKVGYDGEI